MAENIGSVKAVSGSRFVYFLPALLALFIFVAPAVSFATEQMTKDTGKDCEYCHLGDYEELEFTPEGEAFVANHYKMPEKFAWLKKISKKYRHFLVTIHSISAFALLGGIIFLSFTQPRFIERRPMMAKEKRFIWGNTVIVGITGLALLPVVIRGEGFWKGHFGFVLGTKIFLFVLLAALIWYLISFLSDKIDIARVTGMKADQGAESYLKAHRIATNVALMLSIMIITLNALWRIL